MSEDQQRNSNRASNQMMLNPVGGSSTPRGHLELAVDRGQVPVDRAGTDDELLATWISVSPCATRRNISDSLAIKPAGEVGEFFTEWVDCVTVETCWGIIAVPCEERTCSGNSVEFRACTNGGILRRSMTCVTRFWSSLPITIA